MGKQANKRGWRWAGVGLAGLLIQTVAWGGPESVPLFFAGGSTPYEGQIATSESGAIFRFRWTVTPGGAGAAGSEPFGIAVAPLGGSISSAPKASAPVKVAPPAPTILDRQGMTLLPG